MGGRGRIGCASCPKILPSNPSSSRPHHPKEHIKIQHLSVFRCLLSVVRARACTYTPDWQSHALNFAPIFCVAQMKSSLCVAFKNSRFFCLCAVFVFFVYASCPKYHDEGPASAASSAPYSGKEPMADSDWHRRLGNGARCGGSFCLFAPTLLLPPRGVTVLTESLLAGCASRDWQCS